MDVQEHAERELITGRPGPDPRVRAGTVAALTTVAGWSPAREVSGVIGEQQWRAIRERSAAGMKLSRIARELDLDRKTVRRALRRTAWIPYRRETAAPGLLEVSRFRSTWTKRLG